MSYAEPLCYPHACSYNKNEHEAYGTWKEGAFTKIIKSYSNKELLDKHIVATGDFFHSYVCRGMKKSDDMNPKAFKVHFEMIMKLCEELNVKLELTIGNRDMKLIFFILHWASKQKMLHKVTIWTFL